MAASVGAGRMNHNHGDALQILGMIWNCGDVAGNAGKIQTCIDAHHDLLAKHKAHHEHLTRLIDQYLGSENWNDKSSDDFRARKKKLDDEHHQITTSLTSAISALSDFRDQVNNYNDCFHQAVVTFAVAQGIALGASWIPVVDIIAAAGDAAATSADLEEVNVLVNAFRTVVTVLRSGFWRIITYIGRNLPFIVRAAGLNLRTQELINFGVRVFERSFLFGGDGFLGWSKYDAGQILFANIQNVLLTSLLIGPGLKAFGPYDAMSPYGPIGQWAALKPPIWIPDESQIPQWALEQIPELGLGKEAWLSFLRASVTRLLQVGGTATLFNFVNNGIIQGKGWNFNIPNSLLRGTGISTLTTLIFIVGGNFIVFVASKGTQGLPQSVTIPTNIGINGVLDVAVPGLSPLVRAGKGLVYVTAAGRITPQVLDVVKNATGIGAQLPTQTVGANDTLQTIIQRQYGEYNDRILADVERANNLTDPSQIHTGESLVMPGLKAGDY